MQAEVERLVALYEGATAAQIAEGMAWYRNMRAWCEALADDGGLSVESVAGVVAALSPVTPLARNLQLAREVVLGERGTGHPFMDKALAFAHHTNAPLSLLGTRKTLAFAESILSAGRGASICFDTWAYRAMTGDIAPSRNGRKMHDNAAYKRYADNDKGYAEAVRIYREAARICHRSPGNFQAIIWCVVRGTGS